MKYILFFFLFIQISLADVREKFIADFNLKYTINKCYVVPEEIKSQLKDSSYFNQEEAMLCLYPDSTLDRFGLMIFAVTKTSCHACTPETWIYDNSKAKSIYYLTSEIGSWGTAGEIVKVLVDKDQVVIIFKMIFAQMGEEKVSYFVVEFDKKKKASRVLYSLADSDHDFSGNEHAANCSGWKTTVRTDPKNKVISFEKSGYVCDYDAPHGIRDGARFNQKNKIKY